MQKFDFILSEASKYRETHTKETPHQDKLSEELARRRLLCIGNYIQPLDLMRQWLTFRKRNISYKNITDTQKREHTHGNSKNFVMR